MRPFVLVLSVVGCRRDTPPADPEFSDALAFLLREFEGAEIDLAFGVRDLERQAYDDLDVTASNPLDRSLAPDVLSPADVADFDGRENADRDLARALPVAVAALSAFPLDDHARVQLLADQTPVEPYSPDHYQRTFLEGEDCWGGQDCAFLRTSNDLTKDNLLMTVDYVLLKDFRWVDLALPDPSDLPEGEDPVATGPSRPALVGRSWTDRSFVGKSGDSFIHQSFTVEVWIPRKEDGGALRLIALWAETEFDGLSVSDDTVVNTTRVGIDKNFEAAEDWLAENP